LKHHSSLYKPDSQTIIGLNTPLHFAVIYNNQRALKILLQRQENIKIVDIINTDRHTPKDLANMYKNEEDKRKLLQILNRELSIS